MCPGIISRGTRVDAPHTNIERSAFSIHVHRCRTLPLFSIWDKIILNHFCTGKNASREVRCVGKEK